MDADESQSGGATQHPALQLLHALNGLQATCSNVHLFRNLSERRAKMGRFDEQARALVLEARLQDCESPIEAFAAVADAPSPRPPSNEPPQMLRQLGEVLARLRRGCEEAKDAIRAGGADGLDSALAPNAAGQPRSIEMVFKLGQTERVTTGLDVALNVPTLLMNDNVDRLVELSDWFALARDELAAVLETRGLDAPARVVEAAGPARPAERRLAGMDAPVVQSLRRLRERFVSARDRHPSLHETICFGPTDRINREPLPLVDTAAGRLFAAFGSSEFHRTLAYEERGIARRDVGTVGFRSIFHVPPTAAADHRGVEALSEWGVLARAAGPLLEQLPPAARALMWRDQLIDLGDGPDTGRWPLALHIVAARGFEGAMLGGLRLAPGDSAGSFSAARVGEHEVIWSSLSDGVFAASVELIDLLLAACERDGGCTDTPKSALGLLAVRKEWRLEEVRGTVGLDMLRALDAEGFIQVRPWLWQAQGARPGQPVTSLPKPLEWFSPIATPQYGGPWEGVFRGDRDEEPPVWWEVRVTDRGRAELARPRRSLGGKQADKQEVQKESAVAKPDGWTRGELIAQAKHDGASCGATTFDSIRRKAGIPSAERGGGGAQRRFSAAQLWKLIETVERGPWRSKREIASAWRELLPH